ncbi:hypothetical protein J5751_07045 [bacterium]|nr:hypothetical protein [bacterium]
MIKKIYNTKTKLKVMLKLLTLLIVLVLNVHSSKDSCIKTSYIGDLVVQETAIVIAATKTPSPTIIDREQGKEKFIILFTAPKTENPIGRIDQWDFG